jgi:hypothetical protein
MSRPRRLAAVVTSAAVALSLLAGGAAIADSGLAAWRSAERATIVGHDGVTYEQAPDAVPGFEDELFFGAEFDYACAVGPRFVQTLDSMAKLARIIEKSGRRAIWTMGYAKTTVMPENIDKSTLPHGRCDRRGLNIYRKTARTYRDANYLPLADLLASSRHQTYYKTDAHWSSVGGSVFAKALAKRLDPKLGKRQRYRYGTEQWNGMLNEMRGIEDPETSETAFPKVKVKVRTKRGSDPYPGYPAGVYDHSWKSSPAKRTYPGKTLVMGDSFSMLALENLRPLFRDGRWIWHFESRPRDVIDAIVDADTVVIEVYQLYTPGLTFTTPEFLAKLRKALARSRS